MQRDSYPAGVPCWVDVVQDDLDATMDFYRHLFGWSYDVKSPPDAPAAYAYALKDGGSVGGVGGPRGAGDPEGWTHYVRVTSADDAAAAVTANGGTVLAGPDDVGPSGRVVQCADPDGARFGLWEPANLAGAAVVNVDGTWVLSTLRTPDPERAAGFYGAVFGWELSSFGIPGDPSGFFRLPGYGTFLAERDPEMADFQESGDGPEGYADAVALVEPLGSDEAGTAPHWIMTFGVDDADSAFARAIEHGAAEVVALVDTPYTRQATVRDPQGAELILGQYKPENAA